MNKLLIATCTLAAAFALAAPDADAQGRFKARGARVNAAGGVSGGAAAGARGPNGGGIVRGRAYTTDGQGNGTYGSGAAVRGPNGGYGARAGQTTVNADGSAQHQSGAQWSGANSSGTSSGGFTRNADGTVSGSRTTAATGTAGGSYDAQTDYGNGTATRSVDATGAQGYRVESDVTGTRGEGVTRTTTCYDPSGGVIACR